MVHGTVHIVPGRCKGCGLCVVACPQHVLGFSSALNSQGYHPVELFDDLNACTGCAMCALVCPDAVITVYRTDGKKKKIDVNTGEKNTEKDIISSILKEIE